MPVSCAAIIIWCRLFRYHWSKWAVQRVWEQHKTHVHMPMFIPSNTNTRTHMYKSIGSECVWWNERVGEREFLSTASIISRIKANFTLSSWISLCSLYAPQFVVRVTKARRKRKKTPKKASEKFSLFMMKLFSFHTNQEDWPCFVNITYKQIYM